MNNFLLFIGALLVGALVAAFAVPRYVEWDDYRATFEDEASRLLGRRIRVGGSVDLRILPTPYVQFENLRVAGKNGHFGNPLFKAAGVKMWLSAAPLIQGRFQAEQIQLTQPELRLQLDENGAGNWNIGSTNSKTATSSFQPGNLALQEVIIVDGKLTLTGPNAKKLYALDDIDGEFSADSLAGPFKFKGTAVNSGIKRAIRFASSKVAADGEMRFKSTVSYGNTGVRYTLDGKAVDYLTSPRIDGDLIATLPPLNSGPAQNNSGNSRISDTKAAPLELKAKLHADARQLKLTDLSLSFEQAGRPQRLSGEVVTTWNNDTSDSRSSTRGAFNASWLDLDRIAGSGTRTGEDKPAPLRVLAGVIEQLNGLFAKGTTSRISLKIDQANLGGDTVSNIEMDLAKNNGVVTIESLRAQMPGRARIEARGQITGTGDQRKFDGELALHGGNLKQFLGWAEPGGTLQDNLLPVIGGGVFTSNAHISFGMDQISIQDINAEFDGTSVFGSADYHWSKTPALTLNLESPRLNADRALPGGVTLARLLELITGKQNSNSGKPGKPAPATGPLSKPALNKTIKLSIGELEVGSKTYQDVLVDLALTDGVLTMPQFKFSSGDDLALNMHGTIANLDRGGQGTLRGFVKADKAEGLDFLARFLQLPVGLAPLDARRRALTPLRMAVTMSFGNDASPAAAQSTPANATGAASTGHGVDLVLAGSAKGSQMTIRAWLEGGLTQWYRQPVEISLSATNPKVEELVAQLLPTATANTTAGSVDTAVPGRFHMTASGIPADKLRSIASLESERINARFDGSFEVSHSQTTSDSETLPDSDTLPDRSAKIALRKIDGQMQIDVNDAGPLMVLSSLDAGLIGPATPVKGTLGVTSGDNTLRLNDLQLVVAGNGLTGNATITKHSNGRRTVAADLTSNQLSLRGLLQPVLSQRNRPRRTASAANDNAGALSAAEAFRDQLSGAVAGQAGNDLPRDESGAFNRGLGSQGSGSQGPGIWPASSFSFKPFENIDGTLKLATPSLQFGPNLKLANTVMKLSAAGGKINLQSLTGEIPGGRLSGNLQLIPARAGARLSGSLRIDNAVLETLIGQTRRGNLATSQDATANIPNTAAGLPTIPPPAVTGTGAMEVSFSGQALSPRGMIAALSGSGSVKLGPARLRRMNPDAVNTAADSVLDQKSGDDEDLMREELTARLATGELELGPRTLKLTITDGALRAQAFEMQTPQGSVTSSNTIDLTRFRLNSDWQVKPVAQVSQATGRTMTVLPPVSITYAGNLGEIATLEPRISVGALMRELTVRNMERDVEQLELIRLRDEQAAQQEEARRKAEELERARQQALIEAQRLRDFQGQEPVQGQNPDQGQNPEPGQNQSLDRGQSGAIETPPPILDPSQSQDGRPTPAAGTSAAVAIPDAVAPDTTAQTGTTEADTTEPDTTEPEAPRPRAVKRKPKPKWDPFSNSGVFNN